MGSLFLSCMGIEKSRMVKAFLSMRGNFLGPILNEKRTKGGFISLGE